MGGSSKGKIAEICLNTLNHVLIGSTSFYIIIKCSEIGLTLKNAHVFLCFLGYQLLMAEGIMCFYSGNVWSNLTAKNTKTALHVILQVVGSAAALAGIIIQIVVKKANHFQSAHAITGLISMVFLIITLANGLMSLFAIKLQTLVKPVKTKFLHNIAAHLAFVVGMASLILGYDTNRMRNYASEHVRICFQIAGIVTTILSTVGALRSMCTQFKSIFT